MSTDTQESGMIYMNRKQLLLFFFFFIFTFCVYLATMSDNLSYQSDYIQIPITVEKLTDDTMRPLFHVLWYPLGKAVYSLFISHGYKGRSVKPIELMNIVIASTGSALFVVLLYDITGNIVISLCLAMLLSFSYPLWQEFTHTKLYSGGFLFIVLSYYMYTRENVKLKPLVFAVVNGMAFLFHVSNVFIIPASCVYFLLLPGTVRGRLLQMLKFLMLLSAFLVISYLLIFRLTGEKFEINSFMPSLVSYYQSTWIHYCQFNLLFSLGLNPDRADLPHTWPLLAGPVFYVLILAVLLISSDRTCFRSPLFYPSLVFIAAMLAGGIATSQRNPNIFLILLALNIIFALALAGHRRLFPAWRTVIAVLLIFYSVFMFYRNYRCFAAMKGLESDFIYTDVIAGPGNIITSDDLIVANSSIPYYFIYYKRCRSVDIDECVFSHVVDDLLYEISAELQNGKKVTCVLDSYTNYADMLIRPVGLLDFQSLIALLSREFILESIYRSADRRFHIYSVDKRRLLTFSGTITFQDGKGPVLLKPVGSSGSKPELYLFEGLTAMMVLGGKKRVFHVPVNDRNELQLIIPVKASLHIEKIDSIIFTRRGYKTRILTDVPVTDDKAELGNIHFE